MGLGDAPTPVGSGIEVNNPTGQTSLDTQRKIDGRLTVLERAGLSELARQIKWLFDFLGQSYPPPPPPH